MAFEEEYERLSSQIRRVSRTQKVPGLMADEVQSEMLECLWKAVDTFDSRKGEGLTIEKWWWVLWVNRKKNLRIAFFRNKREMERMSFPFTTWQWDVVNGSGEAETGMLASAAGLRRHMSEDTDEVNIIVPCPLPVAPKSTPQGHSIDDPITEQLWSLIAMGYTGKEIRGFLGIGIRRYYRCLESLKTPEVRTALAG